MSDHFEKVAAYVMSDDESEIAKVRAERDYALHALEREIAICHQAELKLAEARQLVEDLLGLELGSSERAMAWLDGPSSPIPSKERG